MDSLQITLFGCVRVTHNNWLTEVKLTREIQVLLAYLLLQRHRAQPREVLAGIFWGELSQERARGSLNTALWKLKKALEPNGIPAGTYLINNHPGEVGFNRESQYWLDVEAFEEKTRHLSACPLQMADETHVQELEKILGLYTSELLEGSYKDWVLRERERLRALYLKSLGYLLEYYKLHGLYENGLACAQQILNLDPLREDIHREMMRLYLENGQRALAVRQYEICRKMLDTELSISPMEETQALFTQIFSKAHGGQLPMNSREQISFDQVIGQLREAGKTIDLAKEQIHQALQMIGKFSDHVEQTFPSKSNNNGYTEDLGRT